MDFYRNPIIATGSVMALALITPSFQKGSGFYGNDIVRFLFYFAIALIGTEDVVNAMILGALSVAFLKTMTQESFEASDPCADVTLTDLLAAFDNNLDRLKKAVSESTLPPHRKTLTQANAPFIAQHLAATSEFSC